MGKSLKILIVALAAIIGVSSCGNASRPVSDSGDEQGLETTESFQLQQDEDAVKAALDGWWSQSMADAENRLEWYDDAKFGCFIHWGVYSAPAGMWKGKMVGGYSEHLMRKMCIPLEEYKGLVSSFNPSEFDADEWMKTVSDAGMKYFVITAKHHDGFAMFPSDAYPYDIRMSSFGRDPMAELREAARKNGIRFGFYYSHAFDWEHPSAPGNDWDYDNPGGDKLLGGAQWWLGDKASYLSEAEKYVEEKAIPQIKELIINYQPDILWFDTPHKLPFYLNLRILQEIRNTPGGDRIVINGRLARTASRNFGDYQNLGDRAAFFPSVEGRWESIPTTNESYGYSVVDTLRKPASHFIRLLASAVSKGGNILMNVGPMGNGKWDEKDIAIFQKVGNWLKIYGESIYGASPSGLPVQPWGVTTQKHDTLFVHVYDCPPDGRIVLGGLESRVMDAWMVADRNMPVPFVREGRHDWRLTIPGNGRDDNDTVVAMIVGDDLEINPIRLLSSDNETLAAFDAELNGSGLIYGDGKVNRNYVSNWTTDSQFFSWTVRLNQPEEFRCFIDYNTEDASDTGMVRLEAGNSTQEVFYEGVAPGDGRTAVSAGELRLPKGVSTISLKGVCHSGKTFMRPISVRLEKK